MDSTDSSDYPTIFFSYPAEVGQSSITRENSLAVILSDFNGSDAPTEGSGSQDSQLSLGGLDRRLIEEAASFAAMEVEPDHQSPPTGTATRKSTSSSDSQVDSQNSQSTSSQDVVMTDSPPRSLIRLWSPPVDADAGSNILISPREDKESADEEMLLLSRTGSTVASSSRATSSSSSMRHARNDDADDGSDCEEGPISRPDYTRQRNEKKRRPIKTTVMDTRGRHRRGKSDCQCPVCKNFFADAKSLSRHRSAFKSHPACLDLDAAPLTVYRCWKEVRGECKYQDHRRDNVINHEATHHPGEHDRNNIATITYDRADLEALMNAVASR